MERAQKFLEPVAPCSQRSFAPELEPDPEFFSRHTTEETKSQASMRSTRLKEELNQLGQGQIPKAYSPKIFSWIEEQPAVAASALVAMTSAVIALRKCGWPMVPTRVPGSWPHHTEQDIAPLFHAELWARLAGLPICESVWTKLFCLTQTCLQNDVALRNPSAAGFSCPCGTVDPFQDFLPAVWLSVLHRFGLKLLHHSPERHGGQGPSFEHWHLGGRHSGDMGDLLAGGCTRKLPRSACMR
eukprot:s6016_g1.t1